MFKLPIRVYYEDTDAGGIVYYANYLRFAERARTEYIRALGFDTQGNMEHDDKFGFMVRRVEADYKVPAILDDLLEVSCETLEAKGASAKVKQEVTRNGQLLVSMVVDVVYVSYQKKRPVRMPEELVSKLESL